MSLWLFRLLGALPLRWIVSSLLAAGLFGAGYRLGQQTVQQAWHAERLQQSLQVAHAQTRQEQINQRITTNHETRKTQLQRLWPPQKSRSIQAPSAPVTAEQCTDLDRLRHPATGAHGTSPMPTDAQLAAALDAAASHVVPDPARAPIPVSCDQLASDAAQATLMVLSFQRWYSEQLNVTADLLHTNILE
jgi:hypothetical protein